MPSAVQAQNWSGAAAEQKNGMASSTGWVLLAVTVYIFVMPIAHSHAIIATCGWLCYCLFMALEQTLPRKLGKEEKLAQDSSAECESETASDSSSNSICSSGDDRLLRGRTIAAARFHARVLSKVAKQSQHAAIQRKIPPPPAEDPPPPPTAMPCHAMAARHPPAEDPPLPPPHCEDWEAELEWFRQCHEGGVELSEDQQAQLWRCEELEAREARLHAERVVRQIGGILLVGSCSDALEHESPAEGKYPQTDVFSDGSDVPDQWPGEAQEEGKQEPERATECPSSGAARGGGSGLWERRLAEPEDREVPPPRIAEETVMELDERDGSCWDWARKG